MTPTTLEKNSPIEADAKVAIIGGGVAGATIALRFAELGIDTTLIEQGDSLVNGPPICHLHAGGNFYREISEQQCVTLLKQSIDTVKMYPLAVNHRPTVVALPKTDSGKPEDLFPRLTRLRAEYQKLVALDGQNQVLGEVADYFHTFEREELTMLASQPLPDNITKQSDWLIAFAKQVDLDKLQFPVILVQEYGLSAFRFAAIASLAITNLPSCHVLYHSKVTAIKQNSESLAWQLSIAQGEQTIKRSFDYVVNACGFKSGEIDDMLNTTRQRMVEFKAAYVAKWSQCEGIWPEVVFYGERGTPQGMAQLTPYPDGYFQLHGMTKDITLFNDGLVASCHYSAQPKLPQRFIKKIEQYWPQNLITRRTLGSIEHMAQFVPNFNQAAVAAKPLFGAQQIPGEDPKLRAADVSFFGQRYARAEIVKASSALAAADTILAALLETGLITNPAVKALVDEHYLPVTQSCTRQQVLAKAKLLAKQRQYPEALAEFYLDQPVNMSPSI